MSGTEEVPGTRPTDTPKKKETLIGGIIDVIVYCLPFLFWIGLGLFLLWIGDY